MEQLAGLVIDMERQLTVDAGVPVAQAVEGDDRVTGGVLPASRYATSPHTGPDDGLIGAVDQLLQWAQAQVLEWDMSHARDGERPVSLPR